MIKKCTSVLLTLLILVSGTGMAFNLHFCEGKIASVSSVFDVKEACVKEVESKSECCGKVANNHDDCCSDKTLSIEKKEQVVVIKFSFSAEFACLPSETSFHFPKFRQPSLLLAQDAAYYCDSNAPPLFKLYNQYLFYS